MLPNFQTFGDFLIIFVIDLQFNLLWLGNILCDFDALKFLETHYFENVVISF